TPIASASIAQVHAATLRTGERVVVKVQRRTVASMVRLDIASMSWIAPLLVGRIPVTALTNPPALVELFAETIVEELDFRLEAQNMLDIAPVFAVTGLRQRLTAFLEGAVLYGIFHGYFHGGILLVRPDGPVALLDFRIPGRLDKF